MASGSQKNHPFVLYAAASVLTLYFLYSQLTLYLRRRSFIRENGCQPLAKQYNKDPWFGLDVLLENMKVTKQKKMLEENQRRFIDLGLWTFGNKFFNVPVVATAEPENMKTVLSVKFKDYDLGLRKPYLQPLLGFGIFNVDGERWSSSRHLLRPSFAREHLADLEAFEEHFKFLLKAIPRDGSTFDIQELFFRLTLDSATEFLFNHSTHSLKKVGQENEFDEDAEFARAFNTAQNEIVLNMRYAGLRFLRSQKKRNEANRICHAYVNKFVEEAIAFRQRRDLEKDTQQNDEKYIFIHELAKQVTDKEQLRDELMNILLAGRDTTASLLSNMFFEIAKKPYIWTKLREEIGQLNGRIPTYEELRNFKYLKWCLNESLRLNPVVPTNNRMAVRDTILPLGGGPTGKSPLFVPKGTVVIYSPFAMHRRSDIYGPDSNEYRPERWEKLRPGWEFIPFNGGPRICLGQQYALTEASYVTARLVQEFKELQSRDEGPWIEQLTLTLCSENGARIGLIPA